MCLVHTLCRVSTEHCLYILLSADLHDPRGVGGEGEGDPRTEVGRDGEGPRGDTGKSGEGVPNSTVGGGGGSDFNLLVLGICMPWGVGEFDNPDSNGHHYRGPVVLGMVTEKAQTEW